MPHQLNNERQTCVYISWLLYIHIHLRVEAISYDCILNHFFRRYPATNNEKRREKNEKKERRRKKERENIERKNESKREQQCYCV